MPTNVNVLEDRPSSIVLFTAMVAAAEANGDQDLIDTFNLKTDGRETKGEVTVLVNGVEVDYESALNEAVERVMRELNRHIKEKALELITNSNLIDLFNAIRNSEWQIQEALNKAFPDDQS